MEENSCIFCYSGVSPPEQVGEGEEENDWRSVGKLEQFIEQFGLEFKREVVNNLSNYICEGCFSSLGKIVEFKKQVDKVEGRVRALQMQVFEQMNELHNCLEKFHDELKYMVRDQMGGDDGGEHSKVKSENLEGIVQSKKSVCSEDAALLRNKVVEVVRNRNFPQFIRKLQRPAPPVASPTPPTTVPAPVFKVFKSNQGASIIPITIPLIPGLSGNVNRKRKGDGISKAVVVVKKEETCEDDSEIEILDEAPPKFAKKENPPLTPSPCPSDSTMKSSDLSEEDSDDTNSLFTPITKPDVPVTAAGIPPKKNAHDPKLEKMKVAVKLKRLSATPSSPAQPMELKKTEEAKAKDAPTNKVVRKKIIYFGDSESSSSSSSSSSSEEEDKPLITFSPRFKVSKWRQRIILGLFGKEKFELGEMRKKRSKGKGEGSVEKKWKLRYNKGTDKLSYGGIGIVFWEEGKSIGCGGRKGRRGCEWRSSHVEAQFFEGITGHIKRVHLGEGGGEKENEGEEEEGDWEKDVTWAQDDKNEEIEEVEIERRSERVVKAPERLTCGGEDKVVVEEEICKVCGKGFGDKRQLKIHNWDYHGHVGKGGEGDEGEVEDGRLEKFKGNKEKKKIISESEEEDEDEEGSLLDIN